MVPPPLLVVVVPNPDTVPFCEDVLVDDDIEGGAVGLCDNIDVVSIAVDGIDVVGIAVVAIEFVGFDVVGIAVVGIEVVGIEVVGTDVVGIDVIGITMAIICTPPT